MIIYLASPYMHDDPKIKQVRWENAVQAAVHIIEDTPDAIVFSPIAHGHFIHEWGHGIEGHWEQWQEIDRAMIAACSRFVVLQLDGWKASKGIAAEITLASARGLEIEFAAYDGAADRFLIKKEEQGLLE